MKAIAVIPARWASTRFPGKPLALICGKPLLQHVWENCCSTGVFNDVIVATDDGRIAKRARQFGAPVAMTSKACRSGTDRVAEVAKKTRGDIFVNVQGDGPFVEKNELAECVKRATRPGSRRIVTSIAKIESRKSWMDPSVIKVVFDRDMNALYFSRSPIPAVRGKSWPRHSAFAHLSVYAFKKLDLLEYCRLEATNLEQHEGLEMLRALHAGWTLKLVLASAMHPEIDKPEDIAIAEAFFRKKSRIAR